MIKSTAVNAAAQSLSSNPHCILHVGVQTVTTFGAISLQTDEPSGPVFPYFGCNFFLPWSASNLAIFLSVRPSAVGRASHLSNLAPVTNGARKCPPRGGARSRWQLMSHQIPHTRLLQVRCRKGVERCLQKIPSYRTHTCTFFLVFGVFWYWSKLVLTETRKLSVTVCFYNRERLQTPPPHTVRFLIPKSKAKDDRCLPLAGSTRVRHFRGHRTLSPAKAHPQTTGCTLPRSHHRRDKPSATFQYRSLHPPLPCD